MPIRESCGRGTVATRSSRSRVEAFALRAIRVACNQTGWAFSNPVTDITADGHFRNYTASPKLATPNLMRRNTRRALGREMFEGQVAILKVLAHANRIHLVDLLGRGERPLSSLQTTLGITKQNLSQHLAILKRAGIVFTRRRGKQVFASLAFPEITQVSHAIRRVLREHMRKRHRLAA